MDPQTCAATREILQSEERPLFKKPRLTDALLSRPPFRFLHDVVTAVQQKTGFAKDLFTAEELDARAVAESREGKAAFLKKLIRAVEAAQGTELDVDPYKVLAGLEPERTNLLLQSLGRVALSLGASEPTEPLGEERPALCPLALTRPPSRRGRGESTPRLSGPSDDLCLDEPADVQEPLRREDADGQDDAQGNAVHGCSGVEPRLWTTQESEPLEHASLAAEHPSTPCSARSRPLSASSEGALVRELKRETSCFEDEDASGIVLKKRRSAIGETSAAIDLAALIQTFRAFGPLTTTLRHCVHHLCTAIEPMKKELVFWEREASLCAERLREAENTSRPHPEMPELQDLEHEIEERRQSIRALKQKIECNEQATMEMLRGLTRD